MREIKEVDKMTREEAIRELKQFSGTTRLRLSANFWEALDMAIKALEQEPKTGRLTNSEWIDFLSEQFDISRTSSKEMLHVMMSVKREDNFKKQFSDRK